MKIRADTKAFAFYFIHTSYQCKSLISDYTPLILKNPALTINTEELFDYKAIMDSKT